MPKTTTLLIDRLRREGFFDQNAIVTFRRLYPGHWLRSSGAWSWTIEGRGSNGHGAAVDIGSCHTVKECLKAKDLHLGAYGDITPE